MHRFALFVDGSNLFGILRGLEVQVEDYQSFYRYLFEQVVAAWRDTAATGGEPLPARMVRVYWYVVGDIDTWDLDDPSTQAHLREQFERDEELQRFYLTEVTRPGTKPPSPALARNQAWSRCFEELRRWYENKRTTLSKMKRFYYAVRSNTNHIDIAERGHWKVDILHRMVQEKGLDTSLAVDMIALLDNYDVAVVISGDADMIPSIELAKSRQKQVAVVEFQRGDRPDKRGRGFASRLKLSADFVVSVYENDMLAAGIGARTPGSSRP